VWESQRDPVGRDGGNHSLRGREEAAACRIVKSQCEPGEGAGAGVLTRERGHTRRLLVRSFLILSLLSIFVVPAAFAADGATLAASFTYSPSEPVTGQVVTFDGSRSTCASTPCAYVWSDDGPDGPAGTSWPLGTGQVLIFTFHRAGTKYVRLTVTDALGRTSTTEQDVTVASFQQPPVAPANTVAPAITGTPQQGQTLTASNGTWTGTTPISYTYAWSDGAIGATDTLTAADVGKSLTVEVTATNAAGRSSATSASVGPVTPPPPPPPLAPTNAQPPIISGTAQQGDTVTVTNGTWTGTAPITYSVLWSDGTTGSSDTLTAADVGQTVSATVTATNSGGSTSATSASVGPVTAQNSGGSSVPCALTHAAGADPINSCWATHTGVLNGTGYSEAQIEAGAPGFTHVTHDVVITQPNTVIDHEWISGCIQIADGANNTTIKNTLVTPNPNGDACSADNAGGSAINTGQGPNIAKNTLIEDTTVDGGNPGYGSHTTGITVDAGEALRVNLFGFAQGFISDSNTAQYPALFQDDYGHGYIGCSHDDGTWFNSSSYVTFEHGYVLMGDPGGTDCTTGALTGGSDYGPQDHVVFDNSYGEGADGEDTHAGCGSTYSAYTNNVLSTNRKDYGSGFVATDVGNAWSGNYAVDATGTNQGTVSDPQGPTCPG
jgi:hypothetical protein